MNRFNKLINSNNKIIMKELQGLVRSVILHIDKRPRFISLIKESNNDERSIRLLKDYEDNERLIKESSENLGNYLVFILSEGYTIQIEKESDEETN